jgi:transcriptional regulator with XRE-family HTH domain
MSQKELATQLGIDASSLSRIESGTRPISQEIKDKLMVIFANNAEKPQNLTENQKNNAELPENECKTTKKRCQSCQNDQRLQIATSVMSGIAHNVDTYAINRPGYLDRLVAAAFAIADKMLAEEVTK